MENILDRNPKKERDVFYYRQRLKNRVFTKIMSFFAEEAERTGITKKDIALILNRDPAQITRWLANPSNMTLDSISDLLLAMEAEIDPPPIVRFSERTKPNYAHPLIARIIGTIPDDRKSSKTIVVAPDDNGNKISVEISPSNNNRSLMLSI